MSGDKRWRKRPGAGDAPPNMKDVRSVLGGTCLAMVVLAGCGGSGGTCGNTAACGGDLVGAWTITSTCVSGSAASTSCPTETVDTTNLKFAGTLTYNADMTYTENGALTGSEIVVLPLSCVTLPNAATATTCEQLGTTLMATPNQSITCIGSSVCTCKVVFSNQTFKTTGTYTMTAAGVLSETPMSGLPSQFDYCVKGKTLTLSPQASAVMMGQSTAGTITLTKS
jgi:hypothetical protein